MLVGVRYNVGQTIFYKTQSQMEQIENSACERDEKNAQLATDNAHSFREKNRKITSRK